MCKTFVCETFSCHFDFLLIYSSCLLSKTTAHRHPETLPWRRDFRWGDWRPQDVWPGGQGAQRAVQLRQGRAHGGERYGIQIRRPQCTLEFMSCWSRASDELEFEGEKGISLLSCHICFGQSYCLWRSVERHLSARNWLNSASAGKLLLGRAKNPGWTPKFLEEVSERFSN